MKHAIIVLALVAACGKKEEASTTPPAQTPGVQAPKTPAATPTATTPDASKSALDKAIADTRALIEKKQADAKALVEKMKTDPMNAAQYKAEADTLQKEIADLQAKLEGYLKEAGQ